MNPTDTQFIAGHIKVPDVPWCDGEPERYYTQTAKKLLICYEICNDSSVRIYFLAQQTASGGQVLDQDTGKPLAKWTLHTTCSIEAARYRWDLDITKHGGFRVYMNSVEYQQGISPSKRQKYEAAYFKYSPDEDCKSYKELAKEDAVWEIAE